MFGSLVTSTQELPHSVSPLPQAATHAVPLHTGVAPKHLVLHEPQLFGSVFGVSQPGAAVQSKKSGPQLQVPPLHSRLSEHEEVHEPQCAVVTFRFTSQPSFASPLQSA